MNTVEELHAAADSICAMARRAANTEFEASLQRLTAAAEHVGLACCGSQWPPQAIREFVRDRADPPDVPRLMVHAGQTARLFERARIDGLGLLTAAACERGADPVLGRLIEEVSQLRSIDAGRFVGNWRPTVAPSDSHGASTPGSEDFFAPVAELTARALRSPLLALGALARLLHRAADHLSTRALTGNAAPPAPAVAAFSYRVPPQSPTRRGRRPQPD